jgi:lactate dehydrogenase-like 2-hydroxyacid dehydrogenase
MSRHINESILAKMPKLKFIQLMSAGYDHVNTKLIKQKNIILANAKDVYSIQIAEHVICNDIKFYSSHVYI